MISYLIIFAILWAIVAIFNEFAWDNTLTAWCMNAVIAFAIMWPAHWAGKHVVAYFAEGSAQIEQEHSNWIAGMQARGCKVTGFVGHSYFYPVWSCPDGTAVRQPFQ